jgi:hypothetical protein
MGALMGIVVGWVWGNLTIEATPQDYYSPGFATAIIGGFGGMALGAALGGVLGVSLGPPIATWTVTAFTEDVE